jgi:hypothetical protein
VDRDLAEGTLLSAELERDLDLVESAMLMVASGAASRATVVGIHQTRAAIAVARHEAIRLGLILRAIERPDGGEDVAVSFAPLRVLG